MGGQTGSISGGEYKDGLGVWGAPRQGRSGRVSDIRRSTARWDGVAMDQTLGAYCILACQKAMDEAGVTPDQIDGVICYGDSHIAGGSGGSASQWALLGRISTRRMIRSGDSRWSTRRGSSRRWGCATSNSLRPGCRPSAKWWAWRPRPWETAFAAPVSSFLPD